MEMIQAKIIRVKGIELSEQLAQSCVDQAKKFGIDVQLFDGINGLEYQQHLDHLKIKPLKKFKKGRPGVYGCFLSHYYLWRECADRGVPYVILEHDGWFEQGLPQDVLSKFDHVLKLDSLNPYSKTYQENLDQQRSEPTVIKNIEPMEDMNNGAGWYSWGAYGYIIKPVAAKLLIDWIAQHGFLPADHQLGLDVCNIKTITPTVVRLHPYFYSNGGIKKNSLTVNPELLA